MINGPLPEILNFNSTKTTISLNWRVPNGSVVTAYTINWERDTSTGCPYVDEGVITIQTSNQNADITIRGLEEDSIYFVRVTAINSAGNSTSDNVTVATEDDSKFYISVIPSLSITQQPHLLAYIV